MLKEVVYSEHTDGEKMETASSFMPEKCNSFLEDLKRVLSYLTSDIFLGSSLTTLWQISTFFP